MCLSCAGRVLEVDAELHEAIVDVDGSARRVSLALSVLEGVDVGAGDWVLVHTGFVMGVIDEAEATELVALHREVAAGSE